MVSPVRAHDLQATVFWAPSTPLFMLPCFTSTSDSRGTTSSSEKFRFFLRLLLSAFDFSGRGSLKHEELRLEHVTNDFFTHLSRPAESYAGIGHLRNFPESQVRLFVP